MSLAGRLAARALRPFGLRLVRTGRTDRGSLAGALRHAASLGLQVRTVIDVGAAFGDFAGLSSRVFPAARHVLVEPLDEFEPFLRRRVASLEGATWIRAAAAESGGTSALHVHADLVGSSLRHEAESGLETSARTVETVALDELVDSLELEPPFLLKLDVQGGELDALRGARRLLGETELVVAEALFHPFYEGGAEAGDLVAWLVESGFTAHDVCDLSYRPLDGALAQADVLFVPRGSRLRDRARYADPAQRRALNASFRAQYRTRLRHLS